MREIRALQASHCFEFCEIGIHSIKVNNPAVDMLRPFNSQTSRVVLSGDRALFLLNDEDEDEDLVAFPEHPLLNEGENLMQQSQELTSHEIIRSDDEEASIDNNENIHQSIIEGAIDDEVEDDSDNEHVEVLE